VLAHQAFHFGFEPSARVASALSSHAGASRFAFNWGLALVKSRLGLRDQTRTAAYEELLCDEDAAALAKEVAVPWTLPSLRKEWNRSKSDVAPWWDENSKDAKRTWTRHHPGQLH
jgi:putative transposase